MLKFFIFFIVFLLLAFVVFSIIDRFFGGRKVVDSVGNRKRSE